MKLTDAFTNDDRFEVFDNNVSIGLTSVPGGGGCGNDPVPCFADPNSSSGLFILGPGAHSITIKVVVGGNGAHYFRVDPDPAAPVGVGGVTSFHASDSYSSVGSITFLAGGIAAVVAIAIFGGWYTRRRWMGNRS